MPGEPDRLMVDPLHQAAVAGNHKRLVVDQLVAIDGVEMPLGNRHADRHRQTLPKRPGGCLDPRQLEILGMAGARAVQFPEILDVIHRRPRIAGEIKRGVDQHRTMSRRQHEAITIGPVRIGRVVFERAREQRGCGIGHAHRHPRMPRIGDFDRVHRKRPDGIGELALSRLHDTSWTAPRPAGWPMSRCLLSLGGIASTGRGAATRLPLRFNRRSPPRWTKSRSPPLLTVLSERSIGSNAPRPPPKVPDSATTCCAARSRAWSPNSTR